MWHLYYLPPPTEHFFDRYHVNHCSGNRWVNAMKKSEHPFHILKEVFDLLPDAVLVVDQEGTIMMCNRELTNLLGYAEHELLSRRVEVLIPARFREKHADHVPEFFRKNMSRKMADGMHLFALHKDGSEIAVDIALSPYEVAGTPYAIAAIRQFSDKKYLEERIGTLQRTKDELEKFALVVSHDLKAPVKRMHMLVDLISNELPSAPGRDVPKLMDYLRQSISLTEKLIAGVLEQARAGHQLEVESLDLNELLSEVMRSIAIPATFAIDVPEPLPAVKGNRTQWTQVMLNLITNAVKYNDKLHGVLRITWSTDRNHFLFYFSDNGTIVPPEKRKSIFQMFYRGGTRTDGTSHGIGLSIVKKIAEQAGGDIICQDSPLGGSEFVFRWPLPTA